MGVFEKSANQTPLVLINALKLDEGRSHQLGGNFYHVRHFTEALCHRTDIRVAVLCDEYTVEPLSEVVPKDSLILTRLNNGGVINADRAVIRTVRSLKPDVYHRPTGQLPFLRLPTATVATIADLNFLHLKTSAIKWMYKWLSYKRTAKLADWVICISKYTQSDVLVNLRTDPARTTVVYHGANRFACESGSVETLGGVRYWLTFGHQTHKNVETAIHVICDRPVDEHLVVVGSGEYIDGRLKPLVANLGVGGRVHFPGKVSAAKLRGFYENALGLLFLSRFEGFGLPILEAMSLGCPVISSNVCSLPEVVGEAGMLVAPDDRIGVLGCIRGLVNDTGLRARMVVAGKEQASRFSWERAADETINVYGLAMAYARKGNRF